MLGAIHMLKNDLLPFLSSIKELFHTEMDQQTSACLYGSATTDDWVAGRSDIDLFVLVPGEKIELFGEKIKIWKSKSANPILDGFVLYRSGILQMVRESNVMFSQATAADIPDARAIIATTANPWPWGPCCPHPRFR
jgi:predicted nucleotidyltransferase